MSLFLFSGLQDSELRLGLLDRDRSTAIMFPRLTIDNDRLAFAERVASGAHLEMIHLLIRKKGITPYDSLIQSIKAFNKNVCAVAIDPDTIRA